MIDRANDPTRNGDEEDRGFVAMGRDGTLCPSRGNVLCTIENDAHLHTFVSRAGTGIALTANSEHETFVSAEADSALTDWDSVEWTPAAAANFFASGECDDDCQHPHSHFENLRAMVFDALTTLEEDGDDVEQRAETLQHLKETLTPIFDATAARTRVAAEIEQRIQQLESFGAERSALIDRLLEADIQRVRDISRLTEERDAALSTLDDCLHERARKADAELCNVAAEVAKIRAIVESSDSYVPQDVAAHCLLTLAPLDEPGKPNTLIALVERAMMLIAEHEECVGELEYANENKQLRADLDRLAGPKCPHDGRRAIEHDLFDACEHVDYRGRCGKSVGAHATIAHVFVSHRAWSEGEAWLRSNGR